MPTATGLNHRNHRRGIRCHRINFASVLILGALLIFPYLYRDTGGLHIQGGFTAAQTVCGDRCYATQKQLTRAIVESFKGGAGKLILSPRHPGK